jgi:hypothetical protein
MSGDNIFHFLMTNIRLLKTFQQRFRKYVD